MLEIKSRLFASGKANAHSTVLWLQPHDPYFSLLSISFCTNWLVSLQNFHFLPQDRA